MQRLACILAALGLVSCGTLGDLLSASGVEEYEARYAVVTGTVAEESGADDHWIVVWFAKVPCDEDWDALREFAAGGHELGESSEWPAELRALSDRLVPKTAIVQHVLRQGPGRWLTDLAPGCYGVGAWSDRDGDSVYDLDEPAAAASSRPERLFEIGEREHVDGIHLLIPERGRLEIDPMQLEVTSLEVRTHEDQLLANLGALAVEGELAALSDERFGAESGHLGYWQPIEFCWQLRPGVYFLEPYDRTRVPVLFVHGALGHPQEFRTLIESLDRTRFQTWFYFYPSGTYLEGASELLSQTLLRLEQRHGFAELAIVAHSMGGLVARSAALKLHDGVRADPLRLFVSIATPWGGMESARSGVENSPIVVPSWRDVAAESGFLEALFFTGPDGTRRRLGDSVDVALIFATKDTTIGPETSIRWEAVRDATVRWPLPYDHVSVLDAPETGLLLGEMLDRAFGH